MHAEMYARLGNKALPGDSLNTVKVINFVDDKGQPVAFGQGAKGDPGPAGPAGPTASIPQAHYIDPAKGTLQAVIDALIEAGLMESAPQPSR